MPNFYKSFHTDVKFQSYNDQSQFQSEVVFLLRDELHSSELPPSVRRDHDGRLGHVVVAGEPDIVKKGQSLKFLGKNSLF